VPAERILSINDLNIVLVLTVMVPGTKMELDRGIRLLTGKAKIDIPLQRKEEPKPAAAPASAVTARSTVEENGAQGSFMIRVELHESPLTGATAALRTGVEDGSDFPSNHHRHPGLSRDPVESSLRRSTPASSRGGSHVPVAVAVEIFLPLSRTESERGLGPRP
jgi:hypothetical protein